MRLVAADSSSDVLPTPAVAGWRRWIWPVVVLALSAAAVAAGVYANRFGADLTTDSGVYMAAGMRLARGQGVSYPNFIGPPEPMSVFPPLYPVLIAGLDRLHLPLAVAIGVCNALCWGLLAAAVGRIVWQITRQCGPLAALAAGAIVTSGAIYGVHSLAMSEPLFLLLLAASIAMIAALARSPGAGLALAAGALVAMAILTRYAAAPLVAVGLGAILLSQHAGRGRKVVLLALYLVASCGPPLAWTLYHREPGAMPGQRTLAYHPLGAEKIQQAIDTLASFILPASLSWRPSSRHTLLVVVAALLALAAWTLLRRRVGIRSLFRGFAGLPAPVRVSLLFLLFYPPFPVVSIAFTDTGIPLDDRILCPLIPPGVMVLAYALYVLAWRDKIVWRRAALTVLAIAWLAAHGIDMLAQVRERTDESALVWSEHRPSETLDAIADLPPDQIIYTNHQRLVYWITHRLNEDLPDAGDIDRSVQEDIVQGEVDIVRGTMPHGGWIVFANGPGMEGIDDPCLTEEQVRQNFVIAEERRVADGVLLRIADATIVPPTAPERVLTLSPWRLEQSEAGRATLQKEPAGARFDVTAIDADAWHVQASIPDLDFRDGGQYAVTFAAKASAPRSIEIVAGIDQPDWHGIGLDETLDLTADWQQYTYRFKAARPIPGANVVSFVLGNEKGRVWIKDVRIAGR